MRRGSIGLGVISLLAAAAGCETTKTCTLIACQDNFGAVVQSADGSFPSGVHRVEVLADTASLTCTFTFPIDGGSSTGAYATGCPAGLMIWVGPAQVCSDTNSGTEISHHCDPIAGHTVETIDVTGAPGQVHVWQYVDDTTILDVAAAPSYQDTHPNGLECGPVCRQASANWMFTLN
jgi:hypothetical protein